MKYVVYILECQDESLYTGITTDLERRLIEHNTDTKGAKYTRGRRPVFLKYYEVCDDRSSASKRESEIKKMTKEQKVVLIQNESY